MNGGDNKPFQPRCPQYGQCQTPSNGRAGMNVPILRPTAAPVDAWGTTQSWATPATNTYDNGFVQVATVTIISGGSGWSVGEVFTPDIDSSSFVHGAFTPELQVTLVDGTGKMLAAIVLIPGCFVAAAVVSAAAANPSASGSGATISITTTQAMHDFGANCNQTGHGYVAACRSWHGIPGFLDSDLSGYDDHFCFATADGGTSIAKSWRDFKPTPSTVKYTTAVVTMGYEETEKTRSGTSPSGGFNESKSNTVCGGGYTNTVNPLSGVVVQSGVSNTQKSKYWSHTHTDVPFPDPSDLPDYYQGYGYTVDAEATEIDGLDVPCGGTGTLNMPNNYGATIPFSLNQILPLLNAAGAGYGLNEIVDPFGSGITWYAFGLTPGTNGYTGHKVSSDGYTTWDTVITRTNTSFSWDYKTTTDFGNGNSGSRHFFGTINLSVENTSSDVATDIENLLALWVIKNPKIMPLSNALWNGVCVKVCRNELVGDINPFAFGCDGCTAWTDPSAASYDDSIIGAPLGDGSTYPADYFDKFANGGIGAWRLGVANISPQATHWTSLDAEAYLLPFSRVTLCNGTSNSSRPSPGQIWKTKLVESSIRLSAYDHARPYGTDKDLKTVSGPSDSCEDFVGVDRFTNVPPMAGRIAIKSITSDSGTGLTTVTTDPTPVQLDDHGTWPVNICDVTMTALCVATPTCSSASVFTFPIPAAPPDFTTAKWICLQGALPADTAVAGVAHWYWADTRGKGQAYIAEIHGDNRIAGEATRGLGLTDCDNTTPLTGWPVTTIDGGEKDTLTSPTRYGFRNCSFSSFCKGWQSCSPWLIVLSGNAADTPTYGERFDFATPPVIDERYGNQDYLTAYQAMRDPMFQYPFCPPPPTCIPLVEARYNMPVAGMDGTEAAPTGDNFISYSVNTCEFNTTNVIVPPAPNDQPVSWVYLCPNGFYVQPC